MSFQQDFTIKEWSKDAMDHPWSFVDGHYCPYPSVTVSMDVTIAVTIPDHPWMDTTVHTPLSQCPWMSQ